MFAAWKMKQLSARTKNEQTVIVAITSNEEINHSQQRGDFAERPGHYISLLYQWHVLLICGLG